MEIEDALEKFESNISILYLIAVAVETGHSHYLKQLPKALFEISDDLEQVYEVLAKNF